MQIKVYSVLVHSCLLEPDYLVRKQLCSGEKYISVSEEEIWFRLLPDRCNCRKYIERIEAEDLVRNGVASPIFKIKRRHLEMDIDSIWKEQQIKVPRIDLISRTDIERAYCPGEDVESSLQAIEYIEEVHKMYLENRSKMIVPFREDPTEGRLLFPFSPDERTPGGHEKDKR